MSYPRAAVVDVVQCDVHQAYRIVDVSVEKVEWSDALPTDPQAALTGALAELEPELGELMEFGPNRESADEIEFVGRFGDGTIHAVVKMISAGSPSRWAVVTTAVCTLEEVPEPEPEEEDEEADDDDDEEI